MPLKYIRAVGCAALLSAGAFLSSYGTAINAGPDFLQKWFAGTSFIFGVVGFLTLAIGAVLFISLFYERDEERARKYDREHN